MQRVMMIEEMNGQEVARGTMTDTKDIPSKGSV